MRLPWVSRGKYEQLQVRYAWAYERGQLQGNTDARRVFRDRIEELEDGAEVMRAACIEAVERMPPMVIRSGTEHWFERSEIIAILRTVLP